eukprot:GHVQ01023275.1.p1 GENE.GHVQ01023275.1~~GHVQ01023275.1.p1  ORF type:complete len:368 (-),score=30.18 GHVQ01023275.1:167-1270(-)
MYCKCVMRYQVIPTPEVTRVYIGSFWDQPLHSDENRKLFEAEANDLFSDIARLPRNAAVRKLNDFIKRVRLAKVHAYLLNYLRKQMPMWGKEAKKKQLLCNLQSTYQTVANENNVPLGDFPPVETMKASFVPSTFLVSRWGVKVVHVVAQEKLTTMDWSKLPKLDPRRIEQIDEMIQKQIPLLMNLIPTEEAQSESLLPKDGTVVNSLVSPFMSLKTDGQTAPHQWTVQKFLSTPPDTAKYVEDFMNLHPTANGKVNGTQAKDDLVKSKLPSSVLHRIWNLADVTRDGHLDLYEYSLARHFIEMKLEDLDLPATLPSALLPDAVHQMTDASSHPPGSRAPTLSSMNTSFATYSQPTGENFDLLGSDL